MKTQDANGSSKEFGYYPVIYNINTERFSIKTLSNFEESVDLIRNDPNTLKDWIYSDTALQYDLMSKELRPLPYKARIFSLPKTHVLSLHKNNNLDDLDFVVWCLSFFTGMRLTIHEAGFIDATPVKQGKLVDFVLSYCTLEDVINLALDYIETERDKPRSSKRVIAAIHALFLSQSPQNLAFERFQYVYMALDACFKIIATKSESSQNLTHPKRVEWMCKNFDIPVPTWATITNKQSAISNVRNDTIHEALFFDEPLGFSIYGGNQYNANNPNIIMQMQRLVSRLLVSILGKSNTNYVKTSVESRQIEALELNNS
jgi:hypothetical protein